MAKIAVLPPILVNKIAAGEVIERPASVVKELVENSLDAGASRVSVELEDGGSKLIRVVDNGCGMSLGDLELSCVAHATSKVRVEDDLYAIGTFGFRGEALASVAAVSQFEIVSRPGDQIEGGRLAGAGGQSEPVGPTAAATGTSISIRNLFYNTPARRKFLRTTNTELGHVTEQFIRIALANTSVQMVLEHNGRRLYELPGDQTLIQRIGSLFGNELADGLIGIKPDTRYAHISGFIAPPQQSRTGTQGQYIFVNGRFIRDRFIGHAIREAYRGLIEPSRQPVVFLFIKLDPHEVDVNVHPTKIEVRFANSNMIHSQVLAAIRDRLLSSDLSVAVGTGDKGSGGNNEGGNVISKAPLDTFKVAGEAEAKRQDRVRQAVADFFKTSPPSPPTAMPGYIGQGSGSPIRYVSAFGEPGVGAGQGSGRSDAVSLPAGRSDANSQPRATVAESAVSDIGERIVFDRDQVAAAGESVAGSGVGPDDRFLQVHNRYIVVQQADGVLIIDQHALHERVIYEQLFEQLKSGTLEAQRRLIPETVETGPQQMAAAESEAELLGQLGILLEPFGPRTLAVQGFPPILDKMPVGRFIADLLDLLVAQSGKVSREELVHEVLDMIACKAAVKAGDPLDEQEIKSLLAWRDRVERSSNCPHGRPTTLKLSLSQLEKQFKRT